MRFRGRRCKANPIVVDGVLYATTTPKLRVIALDAATGKRAVELRREWRTSTSVAVSGNRGVVVTGDRVLFTYRNKLWALDKKNGETDPVVRHRGGPSTCAKGLGAATRETLSVSASTPRCGVRGYAHHRKHGE